MTYTQFLYIKNNCKVSKLTALNYSFFIIEKDGKRYIRKSEKGVQSLIKKLG